MPFTGDDLVKLTENGAAVLLALAIMLACLAAILYLVYSDRRSIRDMEKAKLDATRAEKDEAAENQRTIALTTTLSTVVTANSETTDAIKQLASAMKDANDLTRQSITAQNSAQAETERMIRELAANALDTVMSKLTVIESKLHGPVMTRQLEELKADAAAIKVLLTAPPSANGEAMLLNPDPSLPPVLPTGKTGPLSEDKL